MNDITHIEACTTLLKGDEQTEYHYGLGECPACRTEQAAISEAERYADFGMGWVTSGGDPADARLAWSQDKALITEREEEERLHKYVFDLDDGRNLIVNITDEGIIMDVWGPHTAGTEAWTDNETGIDASHLGTVGMTFEEWADWVNGVSA